MWGKAAGKRGVYLLSRDTLCKPKNLGGANLKAARDMNQVLLAKLGWRILACSGDVWREVLRAKYGVVTEDDAHFRGKQKSTLIWKGVL